jgi:hypothetical protein
MNLIWIQYCTSTKTNYHIGEPWEMSQERSLPMKRSIIVITLALMAIAQVGSSQQISGRGFSVLLCVAEQAGDAGNNQVSISIDSDTGASEETGVGQAVITITHGQSQSTHTATYQDSNESGFLDCGDEILSVV